MSSEKLVCVICGKAIPLDRAARAISRGQTPMYDTDTCANTAAIRRYRAGKGKKNE